MRPILPHSPSLRMSAVSNAFRVSRIRTSLVVGQLMKSLEIFLFTASALCTLACHSNGDTGEDEGTPSMTDSKDESEESSGICPVGV